MPARQAGDGEKHQPRSQAGGDRRPQPWLGSGRQKDNHGGDSEGGSHGDNNESPASAHCPRAAALNKRGHQQWEKRNLGTPAGKQYGEKIARREKRPEQ
jgi:hypothetical protein